MPIPLGKGKTGVAASIVPDCGRFSSFLLGAVPVLCSALMEPITEEKKRYLRALLVLGRVSNLPTVWSNCLAGSLLGGDGYVLRFLGMCLGGSCIYIGGMYLNDAFDVEFDRQHRAERPIASGVITLNEVWGYGIGWLLLGTIVLFSFGSATAVLTLFLTASVLIYDAVHKAVAFSPVLMAFCRFFLFLVAASTGRYGVTGLSIWSAIALSCYIIGLSYVARTESTRGALQYWPCLFLGAPLILAFLVDRGPARNSGLVLSALFAIWIWKHLRYVFSPYSKNIGRAVSAFLAGIVLVDMLAVNDVVLSPLFLVLFTAALLFQRFVPAT
jgi:4-hydroxybenzoate polyprenyltransferase